MIFTITQRITIVELYAETRSYKATRSAFAQLYVKSTVPSKRTIQNLVQKFKETGSVADKQRVRHRTVRTPELVALIQKSISQGNESVRQLARETGVSRRSCQRILEDLRYSASHPRLWEAEVGIHEVKNENDQQQRPSAPPKQQTAQSVPEDLRLPVNVHTIKTEIPSEDDSDNSQAYDTNNI